MVKSTKKEFAWTTEQLIGEVSSKENEKRSVRFCSLEMENEEGTYEKWFVSITTEKFFKKKDEAEETWRPVKNACIPFDDWFDIVELVEKNVE